MVGLDIGPFRNREAHIGEYLDNFIPDLAHRVNTAGIERPFPHRQGDVRALRRQSFCERAGLEYRLAFSQRFGNGLLHAVDGLSKSLAVLRRHRTEALHQFRDLPLLAKRRHAHILKGREV